VIEALAGDRPEAGPSLAVGTHVTRALRPEEIGRAAQIEAVAAGVRAAMAEAGIGDAADVHYVQVKCPLLAMERIAEAKARGRAVATTDTLRSMGLSRGASALGVAVALGEIAAEDAAEARLCADLGLFSTRASASAGVELMTNEIVVLGMSAAWSGPLAIDHAVMADGIDVEPVRAATTRLGVAAAGQLGEAERALVVAVLAKAEAPRSGAMRGRRHTMLDDSDISATRHARGFVAGALGGLFGETEIFVSGGAEHQGPDGGGPCAVIVERPPVTARKERE